jgi:hypothetical protein
MTMWGWRSQEKQGPRPDLCGLCAVEGGFRALQDQQEEFCGFECYWASQEESADSTGGVTTWVLLKLAKKKYG